MSEIDSNTTIPIRHLHLPLLTPGTHTSTISDQSIVDLGQTMLSAAPSSDMDQPNQYCTFYSEQFRKLRFWSLERTAWAIIEYIEPTKASTYPYGGKGPGWWPPYVSHQRPRYLKKEGQFDCPAFVTSSNTPKGTIKLLLFLLRELYQQGLRIIHWKDAMRSVSLDDQSHTILEGIFYLRGIEEKQLEECSGEYSSFEAISFIMEYPAKVYLVQEKRIETLVASIPSRVPKRDG